MDRANVFRTMGATSFVGNREENDFYATEPKATELLLEKEVFNKDILEPCAGKGHIRDVLVSNGYNVTATDLIYRGVDDIKQEDVFNIKEFNGDIITNPPYKIALPILKHCLDIIPEGNKVAMFLKVLFLEGKERKKFFEENPPKVIYVASGRLNCAKNGDFDKYTSSAVAYAWFVFEKGYKGEVLKDISSKKARNLTMIKVLKLEFEGIESVEVSGEYVKQFKNIDNFYLDENGDMIEARKLVIVLDKNANKEYNDGFSSEQTVFDRITSFNDIVDFEIQDEESEHIVFTNYEDDRCGNNKNQYTKIDENGDLHILITDNKDLVPNGFTQPNLIPIGEVIYNEDC